MEITPEAKFLLEVYDHCEKADKNLQEFLPDLECVVNEDILKRLYEALSHIQQVSSAIVWHLGGADKFVEIHKEFYEDKEETVV